MRNCRWQVVRAATALLAFAGVYAAFAVAGAAAATPSANPE